MIRPDQVFREAVGDSIAEIAQGFGAPFQILFGKPGK